MVGSEEGVSLQWRGWVGPGDPLLGTHEMPVVPTDGNCLVMEIERVPACCNAAGKPANASP